MPPESQSLKSTERFTDRVDDYVKYRPHYPQAVFDLLGDELGFGPGTVVADIGSGTGIATKPLLELGCTVYAVEPNVAMRSAAALWIGRHPHLTDIAGTAEETTLGERSLDAIVAAQAFHWFDPAKARKEFTRILKPSGLVVLLWNDRVQEGPFYQAYEAIVRQYATDYDQVRDRGRMAIESSIRRFLGASCDVRSFGNDQLLDFDRLKGLLLSASYTPSESHPDRPRMIAALREAYERFARDGAVRMMCKTNVYFGRLTKNVAST
jgi:SAM-dependent methyltransferase